MEQGLNLIQLLQQTPRWREFEEWYYTQMVDNNYISPVDVWLSPENSDTSFQIGAFNLPFDFLKGVFYRFIESKGQSYWYGESGTHYLTYPKVACEEFNSLEQLLIWYFNN